MEDLKNCLIYKLADRTMSSDHYLQSQPLHPLHYQINCEQCSLNRSPYSHQREPIIIARTQISIADLAHQPSSSPPSSLTPMSSTPDSIPPLTISQPETVNVMKRVKCCTACRRRHRKCVTQPGASQCGTCLESGQECRFENDIRFKHTHSESQKESGRKWAKVPQKSESTMRSSLAEIHNDVLQFLSRPLVGLMARCLRKRTRDQRRMSRQRSRYQMG